MRTIIDISDHMLTRLDLVREKQKCSRAATIREAIDAFLNRNTQTSDLNQSLGLCKNKVSDGLPYQENLRKEWSSQWKPFSTHAFWLIFYEASNRHSKNWIAMNIASSLAPNKSRRPALAVEKRYFSSPVPCGHLRAQRAQRQMRRNFEFFLHFWP